jgi:hypothetical protein
MRWNLFAAAGLLALSLVAILIVACSDNAPSCKPGTLLLQIGLLDTTPLADTITVSITDPGAEVMQSTPHAPNADAANIGVEHIAVEVDFPGGYPADKVVHPLVRAIGGTTILGSNIATIHLDSTCSVGNIAVSGRSLPPPDMAGSD